MNVYSGRFFALPLYEKVRAVFKAFASAQDLVGPEKERALDDYFRLRDHLRLAIRDREGRIRETNWVNIIDFDDTLDDLQIEVAANEVLDGAAGS